MAGDGLGSMGSTFSASHIARPFIHHSIKLDRRITAHLALRGHVEILEPCAARRRSGQSGIVGIPGGFNGMR